MPDKLPPAYPTSVTEENPRGILYVYGDDNDEGSIRLNYETVSGDAVLEKLIGGVWYPAIFETGALDFDLATTLTSQEGRLMWDADNGTLTLGLPGGNVMLQIGEENLIKGKADEDLLNGDLIYISGGSGATPTFAKAQADIPANSKNTLAMMTEDLSSGQLGYATSFGLVRDVNTDPGTYTAGDEVYLSASTAGLYTNIKPSAPYIAVKIGQVVRAHATEGVIFVNINQRTNNAENIRGLTQWSVIFADTNGFLDEDNINFTWNDTADTLNVNDLSLSGHTITSTNDLIVDCATEKTLELTEGVWIDENFNPSTARVGASIPDLINLDSSNILISAFDGLSTLEAVHDHRELNHNYKEGTDLSFHIHWCPTTAGAGNVKWNLEYYITARNGSGTKATGTLSVVVATSGTAWDTIGTVIGVVSGTNLEIADQISLRLYRDPGDAQDTYASDAAVKTYGYHYQLNTIGSRTITTK